MASLGWTLLDLIVSDISRLSAISSKLDDVALAICSSKALLEANQPAIARLLGYVSIDNSNRILDMRILVDLRWELSKDVCRRA